MYNKQLFNTPYHDSNLSDYKFLITGGAGFIGSNIVKYLIHYNAGLVRVIDNLSNGYLENIQEFITLDNFEFINGDIRDLEVCKNAVRDMDFVSHQAALGSVPRSLNDPITTNEVNVSGFLNMLVAAKDEISIKRMVYAASSSTYGDHKSLPKIEDRIGKPLSPYAVTKYVNELYADVFYKVYGLQTLGLRYFNVFGPKQSPDNPYAAVIPLFLKAAITGQSPKIYGNGEQTRDFTFVENVIQANIKALFAADKNAINQVYNIAFGQQISLNQLWQQICNCIGQYPTPNYQPNRPGDIMDSLADISKARQLLDYEPQFSVEEGLNILINK